MLWISEVEKRKTLLITCNEILVSYFIVNICLFQTISLLVSLLQDLEIVNTLEPGNTIVLFVYPTPLDILLKVSHGHLHCILIKIRLVVNYPWITSYATDICFPIKVKTSAKYFIFWNYINAAKFLKLYTQHVKGRLKVSTLLEWKMACRTVMNILYISQNFQHLMCFK
jgi:hypothetical protein